MTNTTFKFENGDKVKDIITGKKGIATGNVDYITGCKQVLISPQKDGEATWHDQDRVKLVKKKVIELELIDNGPDLQAPIK